MSVANLLNDLVHGNLTNAEARLKDWWAGMSPEVKAFVSKVETDEGKILTGLAVVAAQDVIAGGLTTASFTAAAKDVGTKLVAQNIAMAQTDVFAAINIAVSAAQTATVSVAASPVVAVAPAVAG